MAQLQQPARPSSAARRPNGTALVSRTHRSDATDARLSAPSAWSSPAVRARRWPRLVVWLGLATLVVVLAGVVGMTVSASPMPTPVLAAAAGPASPPTNPTNSPPPPLPLPTVDTCSPGSPIVVCALPTSTAPPPPTPACTGEGCIPPPDTATPAPGGAPSGGDNGGNGDADCGLDPSSWGGCISNAITAFFRGIVTDALNPLLDLLSHTLLTTPSPTSLPSVDQLWTSSWQIMIACYGMLIMLGGILIMGYETVQTRHSLKEIAPRAILGFLAGSLSLWLAIKGIELANGLAQAILGGGLDPTTAGDTLRDLVLNSLNGPVFVVLIGLVLAGGLLVLLVTYIVRVVLTILLIAAAPLALMGYALPATEGIAIWWFKAYGGVLAIQVGQSFTYVVALRVLLAPGGFTIFGITGSGLVNVLVALTLVYLLIKIPFWILGSIRGGGRRSLVGSLVRGFIAYKTFGLLGVGRGGGRVRSGGGSRSPGGSSSSRGGPYARTRTTSSGQYVLPLRGLRRVRRPASPAPRQTASGTGSSAAGRGQQLMLPLGEDWPENRPVLGRDGQYRLPLNVQRSPVRPSPSSPGRPAPRAGARRPTGRQLALPFDPYQGVRADRSGQYRLPLPGVHRVQPAPPPLPTPAPAARKAVGRQLPLPLDLPPRRRARP